jgi:hypothetical protein
VLLLDPLQDLGLLLHEGVGTSGHRSVFERKKTGVLRFEPSFYLINFKIFYNVKMIIFLFSF